MQATHIPLKDEDFDRLRSLIRARSGIDIRANHRFTLETRLAHRLRELHLDTFSQYLRFLSTGPFQADEFHELLSRTPISERCFFRHRRQLETFRLEVLPMLLLQRRETRTLRIWNPACASGEETYSIAMLTHRALGEAFPEWHVEILGTDISPCALDVARRGVYRRFSLPSIELDLKARYFTEQDGMFHVEHQLRSCVSFRRHNLNDHLGARRLGRWDAIFCRDSLVWFGDDARADVLATLHEQLADDGFLFVGPTERVRSGGAPFVGLDVRAAGVYLKHPGEQPVGT